MNDDQTPLEAAVIWISKWAAYVGGYGGAALGVAWGWLGSPGAAVFFGILIGLGGLLTNVYFKRREDQRAQLRFDVSMKARLGGAADD
jgi:hypothetical protein